MNIWASSLAHTPLKITAPAPIPSPILNLDQLADSAFIFTVEKLTSPPISSMRVRDKEQPTSRDEVSPKRTWVTKDDASGEVTPFIKILDNFSS